jgi:hypothetical protein
LIQLVTGRDIRVASLGQSEQLAAIERAQWSGTFRALFEPKRELERVVSVAQTGQARPDLWVRAA